MRNYFDLAVRNYGILAMGQYFFMFILSVNPAIFRLFRRRDYLLFVIGVLASVFNHRAILPFMLLITLDLDYSKLDANTKKWMVGFFCLALVILFAFGGG